jgi:protein-tyrosine phosphatase
VIPQKYRFAGAAPEERIVFGAERPGYPRHAVTMDRVRQWLAFMEQRGMRRVCCLLTDSQLAYYHPASLLAEYDAVFGVERVHRTSIADYQLADREALLGRILPFLADADARDEPVVVHGAAGLGRTGQVLAAWLVHARGHGPEEALAVVRTMGRDPYEAVAVGNASRRDLLALLDACRG